MSLLASLLENGNIPATSFFFLESPKDAISRPEPRAPTTAKKPELEIDRRPASKSLTKMNMFSL